MPPHSPFYCLESKVASHGGGDQRDLRATGFRAGLCVASGSGQSDPGRETEEIYLAAGNDFPWQSREDHEGLSFTTKMELYGSLGLYAYMSNVSYQ